jgi:hypothetical protein
VQDPTLGHYLTCFNSKRYTKSSKMTSIVMFKNFSRSKIHQLPRWTHSFCRPLQAFIRLLYVIWNFLSRGNPYRSWHLLNESYLVNSWRFGHLGKPALFLLQIHRCLSNKLFAHLWRFMRPMNKTWIPGLVQSMITLLCWSTRWDDWA